MGFIFCGFSLVQGNRANVKSVFYGIVNDPDSDYEVANVPVPPGGRVTGNWLISFEKW